MNEIQKINGWNSPLARTIVRAIGVYNSNNGLHLCISGGDSEPDTTISIRRASAKTGVAALKIEGHCRKGIAR